MEDELVITPIPSLLEILIFKEEEKGSSLTQTEVEEIKNKIVCIKIERSKRRKLDEKRGFQDLDLDNAWEQWEAYRRNNLL